MSAEQTCAKSTHLTQWSLYGVLADPVETPDIKVEGRVYKPEAWRIMCHHCGAMWAKRVNVDAPNTNWVIKRWPCIACDGGSLWDAWNEPWNRSLPLSLLQREMELVKNWYDEGINTYSKFFQFKHFRRKV